MGLRETVWVVLRMCFVGLVVMCAARGILSFGAPFEVAFGASCATGFVLGRALAPWVADEERHAVLRLGL